MTTLFYVAVPAIETNERAPALGSVSVRRIAILVGATVALIVGAVVLAPAVAGLPDVWQRLAHGDMAWLGVAFVLEVLSFSGHIILFRAVALDERGRIGMRASTEITLAGHMATRVLATAGAGGVALTAWAMGKAGMEKRDVAARMTTFLVLLYSVYMAALFFGGLGLAFGVIPGGGSFAVTIVPALFAFVVVTTIACSQFVKPGETRLQRWLSPIGDGVRNARRLVRAGNPGLIGAILWWGMDIAVLWACFKAFGDSPAIGILVVGYFIGTFANLLPLPGGVGGVDGGLVGALVAFGTDPSLAIVAVLAYRFFSFWLPIAPGAVGFASLRRTVARWEREDAEPEPERVVRRPVKHVRRGAEPAYCTKVG
jgi:uncharacterized membrane protein YbhN (UPF0104 family)